MFERKNSGRVCYIYYVPVALPSNRYRRLSPKSIVYNVEKSDQGWRIEAQIPNGTSSQDKLKVLNWFQDYRNKVRQLHPLWISRFSSSSAGYSLEIRPTHGARDLVENGQDLKAVWTDEVAMRYGQ